jgi:two-component system sensor histidine kinase/response regulator
VAVVASGMQALALLAAPGEKPFDLVLMDWRMPGMNGDDVIRYLRHDSRISPSPKVVIVTAYGREDVYRLAEQAGADGFLVKPVSPSTLLDAILTVLGRKRVLGETPQLAAPQRSRAAGLAGASILLVEDNAINREFAGELLRSEGMLVDEAVNGQHALEMVRAGQYEAVLMDVQMPVMDGLEATRQIRKLALQPGGERYASLPIIAMTALAMAHDAEQSRLAGMNDHLSKPIAPDRLMATLERWIGNPERAKPAVAVPPVTPCPPDLQALASLDAREGIRRIGGNAEAYRKQLRRFRDNYRNADAILAKLIADTDQQSARDFCHALVGVTGNVGAHALYEQLGAISATLKAGQAPPDSQLASIGKLLTAVMDDIDSLASDAALAAADAGPLRGMRLAALLGKLEQTLQFDLGRTETVLDELRQGTAGTSEAGEIAAIAARADAFDIDEAVKLTGALRQRLTAET